MADPNSNHAPMDVDDVELDDDELAALAQELDEDDLSALATELESEISSAKPSVTSTRSALPSVSSARSAPMLRPGASALRGSSGMRFSSTAANARGSSHIGDEFDKAFSSTSSSASSSPSAAAMWRRIVQTDEQILAHSVSPGPLSRAYRGDIKPVPPLDQNFAVSIAVESAQRAASAARLPEDAAQHLQAAAQQSGPQYLTELENAIANRLATDPDFDPQRFPHAHRRFVQRR